MDPHRCCVCGKLILEPERRRIGPRLFCAQHHQRALDAAKARLSRSGIVEVILMVLFVWLAAWMMGDAALLRGRMLLGWSVFWALVPAVIWLVHIHRQDRIEPEPWPLVAGVFVIGALTAHAFVEVLPERLFHLSQWQHRSELDAWIAAVGITGLLQQWFTYLSVRYTVYLTDEFDEPNDGIVYAAAAGLGMATVHNIHFIIDSGGRLPLAGVVALASTTLIHVAAAAVLGYGLGRSRFAPAHGARWSAAMLLLSTVLNGGLKRLAVVAGIDGGHFRPWLSLSVAALLAMLTLMLIDMSMARLCRENFDLDADGDAASAVPA
ncbi:MAG: PrsW family intramembrane metalloprotease [Polyangiales bacterium]